MGHLRASRAIRSLALAWFTAFVLVVSLAPIARAGDFQLVCFSGAGPVLALPDAPPGKAIQRHALDCALCLPLCAPPPPVAELGVFEASLAAHPPAIAVAAPAPEAGAGLPPARAPPFV